jgi:hypothetical protein
MASSGFRSVIAIGRTGIVTSPCVFVTGTGSAGL